jgi:tRNA wybutosine-synthesizing protein 2
MVLLPPGSFGDGWRDILGSKQLPSRDQDALWKKILDGIMSREGKGVLTHLAVNSGIPLLKASDQSSESSIIKEEVPFSENILRTPSGLIMLYGDFGPALPPHNAPTEKDFEQAFWVSTKQNGITQIWAPRYTMFSRGNVKEKARLLGFHNSDVETRNSSKEDLARSMAVDLYAGIGYFVFSYVKMGLDKVLGWELNPWSVEGLRRGAIANGWSVKVVPGIESLGLRDEQIVVILEDNMKAKERLSCLDRHDLKNIKHVNCGLLPTSEGSWETALGLVSGEGWLHLHENVGVHDVEARRVEIEEIFRGWLREVNDERRVTVEHVEFIKTFAPGVWHCVFDVCVTSPESSK